MAQVELNDLIKGFSGSIGKVVFRMYRGKTYMAQRPSKPKKESERQRNTRDKFKLATEYAKKMMKDPEQKAYYAKKAKKLALPNAYTAAITDYMRKPEIQQLDTSKYRGKAGDHITILASKKDFKLERVSVLVTSLDDVVLEQGPAEFGGAGVWTYKSFLNSSDKNAPYKIFVTAADEQGQLCQKTFIRDA
jgi:hypothetical protein